MASVWSLDFQREELARDVSLPIEMLANFLDRAWPSEKHRTV